MHDKNSPNIDLPLTYQFLHFPVTLAMFKIQISAKVQQRLVKSQGHQEILFLTNTWYTYFFGGWLLLNTFTWKNIKNRSSAIIYSDSDDHNSC